MIEKLAERLTDGIISQKLIEEERRAEYQYAISCEMESVLSMGSVLLIALFLKDFIPTIFFLVAFLSLRKRTGGYHFDSFALCYAGTIMMYLLVYGVCRFLNFGTAIYMTAVLSSICIAVIGTVNHPNMNMNILEVEGARHAARWMLLLEIIVTVALYYLNISELYIFHLLLGIISCAVLLILAKLTKQEVSE